MTRKKLVQKLCTVFLFRPLSIHVSEVRVGRSQKQGWEELRT